MRALTIGSASIIGGTLFLAFIVAMGGVIFNSLEGAACGVLCASSPQGDNAVTVRAKNMATHLHSSCIGQNPDCLGDASFDAGFPLQILQFGSRTCPGCLEWQNDHFQCVVFVLAAYGASFPPPLNWSHPLDFFGNANTWWQSYETPQARSLGYHEIAAREGHPASPGDIMVWNGGAHGHVSIVLGWSAHSITFAQANGEKPIQTLPLNADGTVNTHDGYWNNFTVAGYIHPAWLPPATPPPGQAVVQGKDNSLVTLAQQDAVAHHIPPAYFVRQIDKESGFNPSATGVPVLYNGQWVRPEGIAQFLPPVAANLGINPYDPVTALNAAAGQMEQYQATYGGDYAKALAAYNWGPGNLDNAIRVWGANWFAHAPTETQNYIQAIIGK